MNDRSEGGNARLNLVNVSKIGHQIFNAESDPDPQSGYK